MKKSIHKFYNNNSLIYKGFLLLTAIFLVVYFFPTGGKFKYEFQKGKPWQYDNLYAPFDFAIQKDAKTIEAEKEAIKNKSKLFFEYQMDVYENVASSLVQKINEQEKSNKKAQKLVRKGEEILIGIYRKGFVDAASESKVNHPNSSVVLRKGNQISTLVFSDFFRSKDLFQYVNETIGDEFKEEQRSLLIRLVSEVLVPNVKYDANFTEKELQKALGNISYTTGLVSSDELIVYKGEIVEGKKYDILVSLENEYKSKTWDSTNYYWIISGYTILVSLALLMLLLFLKYDKPEIYNDNTKTTFIFINVLLMIFLVTFTVKFQVDYVYVVPLSVLPIILKAFFDARLAMFAHVLTVLLLGFVVPNSFEFIYLQMIAGIVTILTVKELYKRGNLFISVGQITLIYMLTYFAFSIIHEGTIKQINWSYFVMFALNGVLSFLSLFIIWLYERLFGLVSDITLLELSNTNSKLLRELNEKAPGTFQHSMQVANLAEAAANEIGANSMLVRTGALYHDIGKIENPMYFTENQSTAVNPHDDLTPRDSAQLIVNHVLRGIELAKKNGLPDRIIDFIRTHHGTSTVYYFYKKELDNNEEGAVDESKFKYKGPNPFSRETAILMMCDAAEAASKSLKEPTAQTIDSLIDRIITKQMGEGQYNNANITFKEIDLIKKVLKKKLKNIYHLRIEYPE